MMKLVVAASLNSPTRKPVAREAMPWALSSNHERVCACRQSCGWLHIRALPIKMNRIMALVRGVIAASILVGSMQFVLGSLSTNTAVALRSQIASAVAKNVLVWVKTSSPGPMPSASTPSQMASVPLPTPIAYLVPWKAATPARIDSERVQART